MRETVWVSRDQVIRCLRDQGWSFTKKQTKRVELYKKPGEPQRIVFPKGKMLADTHVRPLLHQAGLSAEEIEDFLKCSVKGDKT